MDALLNWFHIVTFLFSFYNQVSAVGFGDIAFASLTAFLILMQQNVFEESYDYWSIPDLCII